MQTRAVVVEVNGEYAVVETERTSACEGCHKATDGSCSVCTLMSSDRKLRTIATNPLGAKVGDRVTVESSTGRMLWYAVLIFVLPLLAALLGWVIGACFTQAPAWQFACAAFGFVVSFAGVWVYSKFIQKKKCDNQITEILG